MGAILSNIFSYSNDNLETFTLLWLDASVDQTSDNRRVQQELRNTINQLKTFDNPQKCETYILSVSKADRIVLIVSGQLGREIVPRIHSLEQLLSIYIYCGDRKANEQWFSQYSKVKGVVTDFKELIARIHFDHEKQQQSRIYEALPISVFDPKMTHEKLTTDLKGNLLHSQMLINSLLRMNRNMKDKDELISNSKKIYQNNKAELAVIDEFERKYKSTSAIEWYTRDCFVSRLLNKALRTQNIDVLFLFQFFVFDIGRALDRYCCQSPIIVYRSQLMSKNELEKLRSATGQFISINSFVSAIESFGKAQKVLEKIDGFEQVIFEIDADPKHAGRKPFAKIRPYGDKAEEEVLFMLGSIFEIIKVARKEGVWEVQLKLCSDTPSELDSLDYDDNTKLLSFGHVLVTMGKLEEAEIYYRRLLEQLTPKNSDRARCLEAIAGVADEKQEYDASILLYREALEINLKQQGKPNIDVASNYNGLGEVYRKKGDHKTALEHYDRALRALGDNPAGKGLAKRATCLNNIGLVYQEDGKYKEALQGFTEASEIWKNNFPGDETSLGMCYNNMGNAHYFLNHYGDALYYYKEALRLYKKNLPAQHIKIASTYNNIGAVYDDQGQPKEALSYYNDAMKIYSAIYPATHPNVIKINENIERITKTKK